MKLFFFILISNIFLVTSIKMYQSNCEMFDDTAKVVKEQFETNTKNLIRICEGEVKIKKCEGKCSSTLQPSFNSANGFQKKCDCCKETKFENKEHILNNCFDINGNKLYGQLETMAINIQQPETCKCIAC